MIDSGIHEDYRHRFESVLENLVVSFPLEKFLGIELYEKEGDKSLASARGGNILVNSYWFSKPIEFLNIGIIEGRESTPADVLKWHGGIGGLDQELERLITHEYAHLLAERLDGYKKFSRDGHAKVLLDPSLVVSGYSIVDPDEWFAEVFAAWRLGSSGSPQCAELSAFIEEQSKLDAILMLIRSS